ncbi:hypothetical protein E2C01_078113 [Portunus trituberculatus]|uniref:Uncharacterized protein n=1 Tax=Portunus trituberculatus TaxID=210409 RepID=A0A5B7IT98_PORTR|nr:hypothetical protein [Portunus trituberculatus]
MKTAKTDAQCLWNMKSTTKQPLMHACSPTVSCSRPHHGTHTRRANLNTSQASASTLRYCDALGHSTTRIQASLRGASSGLLVPSVTLEVMEKWYKEFLSIYNLSEHAGGEGRRVHSSKVGKELQDMRKIVKWAGKIG